MKRHDNKVGHFTSEKGKEDFQIAYDESMALLPKPNDTKNIKTKYGTIRAYYFTKEENKHKEPILLLPGRGASTPMETPTICTLSKPNPSITSFNHSACCFWFSITFVCTLIPGSPSKSIV